MRKKKLSQEEFVKRAKAVHGDKYDYNKIDYKDYNKTKICIICHKKMKMEMNMGSFGGFQRHMQEVKVAQVQQQSKTNNRRIYKKGKIKTW